MSLCNQMHCEGSYNSWHWMSHIVDDIEMVTPGLTVSAVKLIVTYSTGIKDDIVFALCPECLSELQLVLLGRMG